MKPGFVAEDGNSAEAGFALRYAADEAWRRGESNPRPQTSHRAIYMLVPSLNLVDSTADGQAIESTSGHESISRIHPATRFQRQPAVVASIA